MNIIRFAPLIACVASLGGGLALPTAGGAQTAAAGRVTVIDVAPSDALREALARIDAGDYADAAEILEQWLDIATDPVPEVYYWLGIAYYELGDTGRALEAAERAVANTAEPAESWVRLLAALLLGRQEHAAAIPWLERLVEMAPGDKTYWLQLSSAYQSANDYERALAAMQLAYGAKLLTEDAELRRLADLLVHNGVPYQAAEVLERGLADHAIVADEAAYTRLAAAWVAAGELARAVTPLENAARSASTGNAYLRLGELHIARRDWTGATAALRLALERGQLGDPEYAELLLGIGLYGQGHYAEAREWIAAAADAERHRTVAVSYLAAIDARLG